MPLKLEEETKMHVVIIKHMENEDSGTITDFLDKKGIDYRRVLLYNGESLPDTLDDISAIIVLGGPMNVYEEEKHPYLPDEDAFIKKALARKIPFLGICLGAQLLAKACGAKIYKAPQEEIGVFEIELCDSSDNADLGIFSGLPERFPTVQLHGDTFDVPVGGRLLVTAQTCANQAFVINNNAYGLQFHMEVNEEFIVDWFKDNPRKEQIIADFKAMQGEYDEIAQRIYIAFFKGIDKT